MIRYPGRKWKRNDPKPMLFEDPVEERDLTEDSYNRELIARALTPTTSEYLATFDGKSEIDLRFNGLFSRYWR